MRGIGPILAIIGVIVLVLAVVNHYVKNVVNHGTIVLVVVGVIALAIGLFMTMSSRRKAAV